MSKPKKKNQKKNRPVAEALLVVGGGYTAWWEKGEGKNSGPRFAVALKDG